MDTKKLTEIIESIEQNISKLLELSVSKQKVLIQRNHDELNSLSESEEKCLNNIAFLTKQQKTFTEQLKEELNIPSGISSLTEVIELSGNNIISDYRIRMLKALHEIKIMSAELELKNFQNKMLIETSRTFIKGIIQAVRGSKNSSLINRRM